MVVRRLLLFTALAVLAVPLLTAAPASAATKAKVLWWYDGDTVLTDRGSVRLIGIDTPETGTCGADAATRLSRRLAPVGSYVQLVKPRGVNAKDKYDRLLRYVGRNGKDIGTVQIRNGARARYDSRDGYQQHPRQRAYRKLDAKRPNYCGGKTAGPKVKKKQVASKPRGTVQPVGRSCPASAPIKGNADSGIFHRPGQKYYGVTVPEACFATAADAKAAGFRPAKV